MAGSGLHDGAFMLAAAKTDALTAEDLKSTPIDKWEETIKNHGEPSDLPSLKTTMENQLYYAQHTTSAMGDNEIDKIAHGGADQEIKSNGIDAYTKARAPWQHQLQDYHNLQSEVYKRAFELHEKYPDGGADFEKGLKDLKNFRTSEIDRLNQSFGDKINNLENIIKEQHQPDTAPAGPKEDVIKAQATDPAFTAGATMA